jgi:adenosylcobinamide-GDP ribazoletransferase
MNAAIRALGLFTIVPVPAGGELTRERAVAALRWLPLVGAALGAVAGLPVTAVLRWAPNAALVGAVVGVVALALLTRGLHLDGLADTADGLGSRASADRALEIMRRSDVGPFGVVAVAFVILMDVAALGSTGGGVWRPVAALAVAAATGRVCVLHAARRTVPAAREGGFGAFVAGSVSPFVLAAETILVLASGSLLAWSVGAGAVAWPVAQAIALVLAGLFQLHTIRRLGGVTGDVFGAVVEIGTAVTLAGLAFT